jgi:PAS domain S-box-containing protein
MTGFQKYARRWAVPALAFLLLVGISLISVVRIDRQMEGNFRDNAIRMARIVGEVLDMGNPEEDQGTALLHSFVKNDPRILGIRLYGENSEVLLDTASHLPFLPDTLAADSGIRVERLGAFPDSSSLFQILFPLSHSRTLALFMAQRKGEGLPFILPFVAVTLFLFVILTLYFVWQSVWMRGELKARRHAEIALSRKSRIDEIFARYSRSLILAGNMEEATVYVLEAAQELTGSRVGYAGYRDPSTGHLFCPVGSGQLDTRNIIKPDLLVLENFSGVWGEVLQHGHPLYASSENGRALSIPTRDGQMAVSHLLSVPAMAGGTLVGQITIGDGREPYTDADLRVMEKLGDLFALAIRKALATKALRESENRFRVAFKTIPDAVLVTRLSDHTLVDVNDGFIRMSGFLADEVRGRTTVDLGFWKDLADRDAFLEGLRSEGKVENFETRFRVKGGRIVHGLISASRTFLHGEPHLLCVIRGIDHIREAEFQLRKERSFLSKVVETSPAGIIAVDPRGRIIFANQKIAEILGMDIPSILERSFYDERWETTDHDLVPIPREKMVFFMARNRRAPLYNVRHAVMDGRGRRIYLSINAATLWRDDGELDMIVSALDDVSEQVKGEHNLFEARSRLQSVMANLPVILWALDAEGRITLFEGKGTQSVVMPEGGLLGVSARERYANLPFMLQSIERVLAGETLSITVQIGERYFDVSGSPLWNSAGAVVGASGVKVAP